MTLLLSLTLMESDTIMWQTLTLIRGAQGNGHQAAKNIPITLKREQRAQGIPSQPCSGSPLPCFLMIFANHRRMTTPKLSIAEQMQVLQSGVDVATWSLERLGLPPEWRDTNEPGNDERCQDAVNQLFTLTRADIETHLAAQGLQPEKLPHYHTEPGSRDGSYFIAQGKTWELYFQEREGKWASAVFDDLTEARKLLVNVWLPIWLERLRVSCRTKNGKVIKEL
jgi:hypothetical protein